MTIHRLGVVVVTFNSSDVIIDCLRSLLLSKGVCLEIVVIDNASTDQTVNTIREWTMEAFDRHSVAQLEDDRTASAGAFDRFDHTTEIRLGDHTFTFFRNALNKGFASGVNRGLAVLADRLEIDRFWILNPDSVVQSAAAVAFATAPVPAEGFSLMGGRLVYLDKASDTIQLDGGRINWRTGVTTNVNQFKSAADTAAPDPRTLDFITGASMVASRAFYESVGPMIEDYFLYYEEVDWAMRRGSLPLVYCMDAVVYHHAGSAIGSPGLGRAASPFSLYFKHRARLMFVRRFRPRSLLTAQTYSLAKAAQLFLKGFRTEALALLAGSFGKPPPATVRERLSREVL